MRTAWPSGATSDPSARRFRDVIAIGADLYKFSTTAVVIGDQRAVCLDPVYDEAQIVLPIRSLRRMPS